MINKQSPEHIAIIGAGVSGITTALLLQQFGFEVTIFTEHEYSEDLDIPEFASLYPAASIIPHSVSHHDLNSLFRESQRFFNHLFKQNFPGITKHKHFELFTFETNKPSYLTEMHKVKGFSELEWTPSHPTYIPTNGWAFDCFFTDWSNYFNQLIQVFKRNNGHIIQCKVDLNSLDDINHEIIVNCSGSGSKVLLNEKENPLMVLGHLLKIKNTKPINLSLPKPISYNFSPGKDVYKNHNNEPLDVYFYPRDNDWVLGGSRFTGTLDKKGQWVPDSPNQEIFPQEIFALNKEILNHSFGINLDNYPSRFEQKAYRYVRDNEDGVRIEPTEIDDRLVIHNYGHGGAGVTLSWGCSYRILNIILRNQSIAQQEVDEVLSRLTFFR